MEIVSDILKVCVDGQTKTGIVYKCNLNFNLIKDYLVLLKEGGLVEELRNVNHSVLYRTTEKGNKVMSQVEGAKEMIFAPLTAGGFSRKIPDVAFN